MGQRIHPNGLRVGVNRKWNSTWFASGLEWKNLFFYQKEVENFFKALFYYYPYTKISKTKKILLFDVKIFKYTLNKLFIFIFFYKLRTKRRKDTRPIMFYKKKILKKKKKYINKKWKHKKKGFNLKKQLNFKTKKISNIKTTWKHICVKKIKMWNIKKDFNKIIKKNRKKWYLRTQLWLLKYNNKYSTHNLYNKKLNKK